MGAAGDMLMAALLELHDSPDDFLARLNRIGIPNAAITAEKSVKCGITGTYISVKIHGKPEQDHVHSHEYTHHQHNDLHRIEHIINHLDVSDRVKKNAAAVYNLIAEAESRAHGVPVSRVHFHEVGETDAVVDIVGVCLLAEDLGLDTTRIFASPINTGKGHVHCAHGVLPVPAPATAHILRGVPIYSDEINGELCTPTGAALLKHFVKDFTGFPPMTVGKIGYGMGTKDFERVNCVRAFLGESVQQSDCEEFIELVCNLDDMTPEALAFAQQILTEQGALDVYLTPIVMKKGRLATSLTCMLFSADKAKILPLIFKHTTTLGVREYAARRYALSREESIISTKQGDIRIKTATGFGVRKSKPEYEDIAESARKNDMSFEEILNHIKGESQ
jgi:hypothetical protein